MNRKRVANYEEELFVIFYSILNFLNTEYGFNAPINIQYELIKGRQFDQYRNGLGRTRLMQIKYRYFSDKTLQLWDLCYSFFDCTHSIALNTNAQEYLLAKSFHVVFEAMIDELIGTPHNQIPKGLADQEDGKRVDHIYMDLALTSENGQNDREIYYIGDSKYYKSKNSLSSESIYKQYTYARNVVQWNVNLFLGEKADFDDYRSDDREGPFGNTRLQSESTEGYDVIPNFFISAFVDGNRRYNSGRNIERHREPGKDKSEKHCTYMQYQFEDRLFDRDTLFLSHYDVNFLYVLYLYARNRASEKAQWKSEVRKMFRDEIRSVVQQRFEIYAMQPHSEVDGDEYIRMHFYELNGRVFKPYGESRGTFLAFAGALDGSGQLKDESRELKDMLAKHFYIAKCDMGEDPEDKINEAKASMKDAPAMEVEPENYLTLHWLEKHTGQSVLLGFYKSAEHLDWILSNKKYNVRLKKRNEEGREGSHIKSEYESHNVKFAILYGGDYTQTGRYRVFEVRNTATAMKPEEMEKLGYPNPQGSYLVYSLDEEVSLGKLDIRSMLHNLETEHVQTASRMDIDAPAYEPIFVKAEQLKQYRKSLI
ncbi:MAG: restriction endonuclease [Paludibacteraceae bacterium]|nr:restriction endonuclease [Paludibacteraceae bacterium]